MSPGKVLKNLGAGFLVTLIEGANEWLSIEYNIVVLKISPVWNGGWGLIMFFVRYEQSYFEI